MEYKWYKYDDAGVQDSFAIRRRVFCGEVGFSEDFEFDSSDKSALHLVAYGENGPVCTARILNEGDNVWHLGRLCCLKSERGKGWGRGTLAAAVEKCRELGGEKVILGSKYDKKDFYHSFGFRVYGDVFYEEGIPHIMMELDITGRHPAG